MKKLSIVVVLLLSVFTFANAQNAPQGERKMLSPEERAKRQTEMLSTKLNLTAAQKTQVEAIFLSQAASVDSLRKASAGDMQAMRGAMKPIQTASDAKLMGVLTAEQKTQYTAMQEERKAKMQQGGSQPKKKKEKSEK